MILISQCRSPLCCVQDEYMVLAAEIALGLDLLLVSALLANLYKFAGMIRDAYYVSCCSRLGAGYLRRVAETAWRLGSI